MKNCMKCGQLNEDNAKFCRKCGDSIQNIIAEANHVDKVNNVEIQCTACGQVNDANAKFCSKCGTLVKNAATKNITGRNEQAINEVIEEQVKQNDFERKAIFCAKCGESNTGEYKFCKKCGTILSGEGAAQFTNAQGQKATTKDPVSKFFETVVLKFNENKHIFKKKEVIISAVAVVAVLVIGIVGFTVVSSANKPAKVVEKFRAAVDKGDTKELKKLLYYKDDSLEIDTESVESMIKLFENNPSLFKDVMSDLNNDILFANTITYKGSTARLECDELFALTVKNKNTLFTKYAIMVQPIYINIDSNITEAQIYLGDKKLEKFDKAENTIGPFLPGELAVTLKAKDITDKKIEETLTVNSSYFDYYNESYAELEFFKDYDSYEIYTNVDDAKIYVNGTDTGVTVKEASNKVGPILEDDVVQLVYSVDGVKYKTSEAKPSYYYSGLDLEFSQSDYSEIARYLDINADDEDSDEVSEVAQKYIEKYEEKDYIISDSDTVDLSFKALDSYTYEELYIARNEMLARHGYVFKDYPNLQKYFESKSWYKANKSFDGELTDDIEKKNYGYIESVEYLKMAYANNYSVSSSYVFRNSDIEELTASQVRAVNDWELVIARNEIYARYGLEFSLTELLNHFKSKSWFVIDESVGNDVKLNDVENKNIQTILTEEKTRITSALNHDLGEW